MTRKKGGGNNTKTSDKKIRYSSRGKVIPKSEKFDDILKNSLEVNDAENTIVLLSKKNSEKVNLTIFYGIVINHLPYK